MCAKDKLLVRDVMLTLEEIPLLKKDNILKEALMKMGKNKLGIVFIIDDDNCLLGIITDGDIRRNLLKIQKPFSAFFSDYALDHVIPNPTTIKSNDSLIKAVQTMEIEKIWDLPVIDDNQKLVGLLHLHPAIKALLWLLNYFSYYTGNKMTSMCVFLTSFTSSAIATQNIYFVCGVYP